MDCRKPIALVIVTGFLGAGKTTLLNRILKSPDLANTAVIINEFGDVSLDHLLVEQTDTGGIIELGSGCLCCTVRGELVDLLLSLPQERITLDRVIIETTGLADPVPLLQSIIAHPMLSQLYRTECVLTVIDGMNGSATLDQHEEARRQAALADRIIISKGELGSAEERCALLQRLSILNGSAELLDAQRPWVTENLLHPVFDGPRMLFGRQDHHDHDAHNHHHHQEFQSVTLRHGAALPRSAIENFLDLLASQQEEILRIKGLVETLEHPEHPLVIQGVKQLLHRPEYLPEWPDGERGARMVVIGSNLDLDYIRRLFAAFTGQMGIDTPDRTALEENPLSIPGFKG